LGWKLFGDVGPLAIHEIGYGRFEIRDGDTNLLHAIAVANGNSIVRTTLFISHRLDIDGDAEGRADLVLAAV
jgi:hypothetical protein